MTRILLNRTGESGKNPSVSQLEYGELALNYADGDLFYKSSTDQVLQINANKSKTAVSDQHGNVIDSTYSTTNFVNNKLSTKLGKTEKAESAKSADSVAWDDVQNKPKAFTPDTHTHAIADVTNLQQALDGKQPSGDYVDITTYNELLKEIKVMKAQIKDLQEFKLATETYRTEITDAIVDVK